MQKVENLIEKNMLIGDMISMYPKTVDIMLSWGLACVGCSINTLESVEDGARVHGQMNDEEIDNLLLELNSVAKPIKKLKIHDSFYVTKRALDKIKETAIKEKKKNYGLRLSVIEEDGDLEYELEFKKNARKIDNNYLIDDFRFFIEKESEVNLESTLLDYIKTPLQEGFKFDKLK